MISILLVDDEPNVLLVISETLVRNGYTVRTAGNVTDALIQVRQTEFDAAIIDLAVARENGMQVARAIRERSPYTAIIILTGQGNLKSAMEAIQINAQSYLLKPVSPAQLRESVAEQLAIMAEQRQRDELASHMRAAIASLRTDQALAPATSNILSSGSLRLDIMRRYATLHGNMLELTDAEFDLLLALVRAAGTPLDARTLVQSALGYDTTDAEARELVKSHISHLRYKLEPSPTNPSYILTVRGKGYLWAPD